MTDLTRDDILKLAQLSKLELTDEQIERFKKEIQEIVQYVEILQEAEVEGVEPTNQISGLVNSTRSDEIKQYEEVSELLKNLPNKEDDQIKVKRMIG